MCSKAAGRPRDAVQRLVEEYMGASVYMAQRGAVAADAGSRIGLRRLPADRPGARIVALSRIKRTPAVAGVMLKRAAVESFRETIAAAR